MACFCWIQSHNMCMADLCGALHCDIVMDSAPRKTKCNPAAAARNKHLCEVPSEWFLWLIIYSIILCVIILGTSVQSLADSCFSVRNGPVSGRLHGIYFFPTISAICLLHLHIFPTNNIAFWCFWINRILLATILWCPHLHQRSKALL